MAYFLLKRLAFGVSLIVVATTVTFFLVYSDGDQVARNILGQSATAPQIAARSAELGLDRPLLTQFLEWMGSFVRGDLGSSYFTGQSVTETLVTRLPVTLSVVLAGVVLTGLLSAALGLLAAVRRGWVDRVVQVVSVVGLSLPNYWLGLMLVVAFAVNMRLFPATGYVAIEDSPSRWAASIALPVLALSLSSMAAATQQVRGAVIDVLEADFVRTLRSRGLSTRSLLFKHALKNAAPPALTVLSVQFIGLLGGAIVIEKIFALPGLGALTVDATLRGDVPVVLGVVATTVVLVVIVNLAIDLLNGWLNPKVRVR